MSNKWWWLECDNAQQCAKINQRSIDASRQVHDKIMWGWAIRWFVICWINFIAPLATLTAVYLQPNHPYRACKPEQSQIVALVVIIGTKLVAREPFGCWQRTGRSRASYHSARSAQTVSIDTCIFCMVSLVDRSNTQTIHSYCQLTSTANCNISYIYCQCIIALRYRHLQTERLSRRLQTELSCNKIMIRTNIQSVQKQISYANRDIHTRLWLSINKQNKMY